MIRAFLCVCCLVMLSGCAGSATFSVKPFREPVNGEMVCCEFDAMDWRDIGALSIDASKSADGSLVVHFNESAVGATAPTAAQSAAITGIAGAVSNAAAAAIKIVP
jgi:hypothetical protein